MGLSFEGSGVAGGEVREIGKSGRLEGGDVIWSAPKKVKTEEFVLSIPRSRVLRVP
ncbi:hypothetical protein RBS60_17305 [Sinomonas sp. ASV486]|uniref:hypothetical protein n=1 Tax=Sinomonas sp. ASV486 TaxID=3051170 RepID=UPI0027DBACD6|nr:hypothetical protein [Sinomonas sp. ASV486]MDQ4491960.1 hypothetical protein [Sinomonas sp. ASV486]